MQQYTDLAKRIIADGHRHPDRTGVGRISLYGETLRFKMADGFPILTTRKVHYEAAFKEMLWFISGDTNIKTLGSKIWDPWATKASDIEAFVERHAATLELHEVAIGNAIAGFKNVFEGSIGPMYGFAWRHAPVADIISLSPDVSEEDFAPDQIGAIKQGFRPDPSWSEEETRLKYTAYLNEHYYGGVDQLYQLVTGLKNNPYGSRHVMTTWIPSWLPHPKVPMHQNPILLRGVLAPCHILVQCHVIPPDETHTTPRLILQLYQRSADFLVGSVFNIAQ